MCCGKSVDNLNKDGECLDCVNWQNEQREKTLNGWSGLKFAENERPMCCQA